MPALKYWDVASSSYILLTPGATTFPFTYYQTLPAPTTAAPFQINHNLNTMVPLVQVYDAVTGQMVQVQITVVNANSIQVSVGTNMPNNVNVIVHGSAQAPVPVAPANLATMQYVQSVTPTLPAPLTSGSGTQSFTDSLGDVWVAANGVYSGAWKRARDALHARWYRSAAWQVTGSIGSPFCDTRQFDAYSMYGGSSTGLYTVPVAGLYLIYAGYTIAAPAATGYFTNQMIRYGGPALTGGTRIVQTQVGVATTGTGTYIYSQVTWPCNAGDQFWQEAYSTSAGLPYTGSTGGNLTYFCIDYLGTG